MAFVSLSEEKRLRESLNQCSTEELKELVKMSHLFSVQAVAKQILAERNVNNDAEDDGA